MLIISDDHPGTKTVNTNILRGYNYGMRSHEAIIDRSHEVIALNDRGEYTVPSYLIFKDSQFLWDSCITAQAIAHTNTDRAQQEIMSLFRGQAECGRISNETLAGNNWRQKAVFGTEEIDGVTVSGITQPPTIATAVVEIGKHMGTEERDKFFRAVFEPLTRYHTWLLNERVIDETGLVTLIHPYESGMDNLPPWREALNDYWLGPRSSSRQIATELGASALGMFRRLFADTKHVPKAQRADNHDVFSSFLQTRVLARNGYDIREIWDHTDVPLQQDIGFNALLAEANQALIFIADTIDDDQYSLDAELSAKIEKQLQGISKFLAEIDLANGGDVRFYNRDARAGKLIRIDTVGGLLPLVADIPKEQADALTKHLTNPSTFWSKCPIPSVSMQDPHFSEVAYWRGVSWPFPRVAIERALRRRGNYDEAHELRHKVLARPGEELKTEYDHPRTGIPLGIHHFGPTAGQDIIFAYQEMSKQKRYTIEHGESEPR